jgi:cytidylate kinase
MKLTLLFGRICSGKSTYYPTRTVEHCGYRIVISNIVRGLIENSSREQLQNTMHLDKAIANAVVSSIEYAIDGHPHIVVDGIRQASIVHEILKHWPDAELIWLEVPVEERKRRYESRKDIKDVESFEVADNKPIELECQEIFSIFKEQLRIINN